MNGWIDEVEGGMVYGRLIQGREEYVFSLPVGDVLEDQRVDLEPCRYVSFVNGHMLIDKTIWSTHDVENADQAAIELHESLGWGRSKLR